MGGCGDIYYRVALILPLDDVLRLIFTSKDIYKQASRAIKYNIQSNYYICNVNFCAASGPTSYDELIRLFKLAHINDRLLRSIIVDNNYLYNLYVSIQISSRYRSMNLSFTRNGHDRFMVMTNYFAHEHEHIKYVMYILKKYSNEIYNIIYDMFKWPE